MMKPTAGALPGSQLAGAPGTTPRGTTHGKRESNSIYTYPLGGNKHLRCQYPMVFLSSTPEAETLLLTRHYTAAELFF